MARVHADIMVEFPRRARQFTPISTSARVQKSKMQLAMAKVQSRPLLVGETSKERARLGHFLTGIEAIENSA